MPVTEDAGTCGVATSDDVVPPQVASERPTNRDESDQLPWRAAARRTPSSTGFVLPGGAFREHDGQMNRRDYCPIAASVEVLGDRWTPLIIREVMVGASGFNEIHRGIPRVSRTMLAQRLRELERRGLMRHETSRPGRPGVYALTAAGQALEPFLSVASGWSVRSSPSFAAVRIFSRRVPRIAESMTTDR